MKWLVPAAMLAFAGMAGGLPTMADEGVLSAELNGLKIDFDRNSGSIVRLELPGPGVMLDSGADRAGIIDLAYPVPGFEALRLASRYSRQAKIAQTADEVVVAWDSLGKSRDLAVGGSVAAQVRLKAAPDGHSIVMSCHVANHSENAVRQVLFPDFAGLLPFAGEAQTLLRTGAFATPSFLELAMNEDRASLQYMLDTACSQAEYRSGGIFNNMWLRWLDFGSLSGGLSLFPKRWGWDTQVATRVHLSEVEKKLRLLCVHDVTIKPAEDWDSGEFVLTPHRGGWAKGIEPFREWVLQHYKRQYPVPRHVREGLGYRTTWMCQNQEADPRDAIFTFRDIPKLARECKEHGLDEMMLWAWHQGFVLPLPAPHACLGTEQDFVNAVKESREIGVNVVPFISVLQANAATAGRYGLKVTDNNGWTYHTELVPRWNPPYASSYACVPVPVTNELWRKDVLDSAKHLIDIGICSLGWDQYWTANETPSINSLSEEIRKMARAKDPESTFSGEELWNLEIDSSYLDYTWNWGGYRDCRAYTSVFPAPRINCCVTSSPAVVKLAFADNLYLNVFPRKPESVNGSDYIANYPELSRALKQCASLRKQFLPFFTDGTLIGDCILTEPAASAHVTAYVLPDRVLMILINRGEPRKVGFECNLEPWLASKAGKYRVRVFDMEGHPGAEETMTGGRWHGETATLQSEEIALYEFTSE